MKQLSHKAVEQCIACGAGLQEYGKNGKVRILRCPKCGLGVTGKGGGKQDCGSYHRDPVYLQSSGQFKNIFSKRVELIEKFTEPGKALEIGTSTGLFLSLLKSKGWEVQGIEPSQKAVEAARARGIPTFKATFEEVKLKSNSIDLVIFNHVLEHMKDPEKVLVKAHKLLKKGGFIFIDVPNFASFSSRTKGASWKYVLPQEHNWHFTKDSLELLFKKTGFSLIFWDAHSGIWGYGNPAQEVWQSLVQGKKRFFGNIFTAFPALVLTRLKIGTSLTVIGKKV